MKFENNRNCDKRHNQESKILRTIYGGYYQNVKDKDLEPILNAQVPETDILAKQG